MHHHKEKYVVWLIRPQGVTVAEIKKYIRDAIASMCGSGCPDDPMYNLDRGSVRVSRSYYKKRYSRTSIVVDEQSQLGTSNAASAGKTVPCMWRNLQRRITLSTITAKSIIVEMLESGGSYQGDPVPESIWSFTNRMNGEQNWAVFYPGVYCDIWEAEMVKYPVLLFADGELTEEGQEFLGQPEETCPVCGGIIEDCNCQPEE